MNTSNVQEKSTNPSENIVVSNLKDMFEIMGDFEEGTGGRRVSRARKQVNYALPNLRDKMRREDNPEERGKGRRLSVDRSVTPDQIMVSTIHDSWLTLDDGIIPKATYDGQTGA